MIYDNAIYQYYYGKVTSKTLTSIEVMKKYAESIGCDYYYEYNPQFVKKLNTPFYPHFGAFGPVYSEFFKSYDYILFADTDIFPVDNLKENIFEQFYETEYQIGICKEIGRPEDRLVKFSNYGINNKNDEKWITAIENKWQVKMPRTNSGLPEVYNGGVVVYSKDGLNHAYNNFIPFEDYINFCYKNNLPEFYASDQPYLHAMLEVCGFNWIVMDPKWNSLISNRIDINKNKTIRDMRNNSNFVHIQTYESKFYDKDKLYRLTNLSIEEWNI